MSHKSKFEIRSDDVVAFGEVTWDRNFPDKSSISFDTFQTTSETNPDRLDFLFTEVINAVFSEFEGNTSDIPQIDV